jgi:hypothetical protein
VVGQQVTEWLQQHQPNGIYDHRLAHKLREFGIFYAEDEHLLVYEGLMVELPTHTPAELIASGIEWLRDERERYTTGYDLARALRCLLWPLEIAPEIPDVIDRFNADSASISERTERSYR